MRPLRWLTVVLTAATAVLLTTAGPAAAHAGGLVATDARSRVVTVTPAVPGLTVTAIEDGARLRLTNRTPGPVTVTGRPGVVAPGDTLTWADPSFTPEGKKIASGRTQDWTLTLDAGGTAVTVSGILIGERPPDPWPWWALAIVAAVAIPVIARRLHRGDLLLCAAGTVAMAASIGHVAGSTLAVESAPPLGTFLSAAGINLLAWPLILGGAVTTLRGRPAGLLAVCAGAALTAVFVFPDVTAFHRAVLPFAGPAVAERALVVLALGLGAGVAVAGASVLRTLAQRAEAVA
ncbi:hypothetical protein ACWT_5423 [Actinoplanes sp. SE50]|uniref:hypothetical protein n=1 Tax=unclassified Actinoplanes TaxID=2626549 RepID=UPI00023EC69F|nr:MULTISPECIES: hypothetical protein [unclassified Actinoplanes]AEV86440.1 hypothetical protein ACPL_5553 [Actinoplanes sp. SE50/110]ATO84838.1 hypothetical protein ACWT_5423 [Actinoplanes sp. SE50]SLM02247.1 hypothetical protein ACSP50_5486 [Actinoplanes sp. SE50/110]